MGRFARLTAEYAHLQDDSRGPVHVRQDVFKFVAEVIRADPAPVHTLAQVERGKLDEVERLVQLVRDPCHHPAQAGHLVCLQKLGHRVLALGDVDDQPNRFGKSAFRIRFDRQRIIDPDIVSGLVHQAIFGMVGLAWPQIGEHGLAMLEVVRMNSMAPPPRYGGIAGAITKDLFQSFADIGQPAFFVIHDFQRIDHYRRMPRDALQAALVVDQRAALNGNLRADTGNVDRDFAQFPDHQAIDLVPPCPRHGKVRG